LSRKVIFTLEIIQHTIEDLRSEGDEKAANKAEKKLLPS